MCVCAFVPIYLSEDQKCQEEITILMMIPSKKLKMMLNNRAVQNIQGRRTGRIQVPEMLQPGVSPRPKYLVPGMVRERVWVCACVRVWEGQKFNHQHYTLANQEQAHGDARCSDCQNTVEWKCNGASTRACTYAQLNHTSARDKTAIHAKTQTTSSLKFLAISIFLFFLEGKKGVTLIINLWWAHKPMRG